ncbi:MAG: hypothetical protein A2268_00905 [Candidatus Raymondbacteria bacterium RifOxyA12_full_50_37]|uniref:Uncharacterized protein n=1 Tax=Candidatus Raymondbacteria bacterium RIFOXYD12_FULL_49_13 TaxID=1817890 RepID=A0A1F7FFT8_UNCRA|nr:MAG: hypothetical protein A2268_00905 [Candidatus Raymondbacteria bacterium RifOxyA12_full_50_37]OGJ86362.1 MAG: hypothetical protein A2248_13870 [Candidatus Raymondbacteria bacterium RIFOXYA2_FULL_49_16]OGJ95532.1 MAG: hypothetical protein A2453_12645 [Candidatus Raymondbacteria bacterium RIFOXYC2_FULL_50_21]OGJ96105.1 MAG: hypothetical protein A2487_01740 [Candidatus Raymondbacteria bacterium RifOxyC12_full_50_8]OGJ96257.1 MAG: hypothetical protein A2350_02325 [Candidatus Raymondbacteria b
MNHAEDLLLFDKLLRLLESAVKIMAIATLITEISKEQSPEIRQSMIAVLSGIIGMAIPIMQQHESEYYQPGY